MFALLIACLHIYPKNYMKSDEMYPTKSTASSYWKAFTDNLQMWIKRSNKLITSTWSISCIFVCFRLQPSIKYILKHRANELKPDQVCGILMQHSECSANKNWLDFTIKSDREPVLKVSDVQSLRLCADNHYDCLNRHQRSIALTKDPWIPVHSSQ